MPIDRLAKFSLLGPALKSRIVERIGAATFLIGRHNATEIFASAISMEPRRMKTHNSKLLEARQLLGAADRVIDLGNLLMQFRGAELTSFCRQVALHKRKAYRFILIAHAVNAGQLQEADVANLGGTKAWIIASSRSTVDVRRAVAYALDHTIPELEAYLATGIPSERVTRVFHLTKEGAAELDSVLLSYGAKRTTRGLINREQALMRMLDWAGSRGPKTVKPARESA